MRCATALFVCIVGLQLSACVPVSWHYAQIEAPGAVYYQNMCRAGSGPPALVFYPFHGIFISLDIIDAVRLGFHIPKGYTVEVNDKSLRITALDVRGSFEEEYQLRAFKQAALGNGEPPVFLTYPDPYTNTDNFGPLAGGAGDSQSLFYLFLGIKDYGAIRIAPLTCRVSSDHSLLGNGPDRVG